MRLSQIPHSLLLPVSFLVAALAAPRAAEAMLIVMVERTSDATATITANGDTPTSDDRIRLLGATSVGDDGPDTDAGDFTLGGIGVFRVFVGSGNPHFVIDFDALFPVNAAPAGTLFATLDVEQWAPVGTTGNVTDGAGNALGSYTIVPEPGTAAALAAGLAGLGLLSGRRRRS